MDDGVEWRERAGISVLMTRHDDDDDDDDAGNDLTDCCTSKHLNVQTNKSWLVRKFLILNYPFRNHIFNIYMYVYTGFDIR